MVAVVHKAPIWSSTFHASRVLRVFFISRGFANVLILIANAHAIREKTGMTYYKTSVHSTALKTFGLFMYVVLFLGNCFILFCSLLLFVIRTVIANNLLQNNIQPPSTLSIKADYHLFKKNVRPEWEDPENKHGGKWSFSIKDKDRNTVSVDQLWLMTQLTAIGELFEQEGEDEVMGVVVNVRKTFYRIGLWTRSTGKANATRSNAEGEQTLRHIGKRFRETLNLNPGIELEFSGHTESQQMGSTRAKAKYSA